MTGSRRLLASILVLVVLTGAAVVFGTLLAGHRHSAEAVGPTAPYQMAVDADPAQPGVQASRTVSGPGVFTVGIDVTRIGTEPYAAIQWEISLPNGGLSFVGDVVEHTDATGFPDCSPPQLYEALPGETAVFAACGRPFPGITSTFVGETTKVSVRCLADGTFSLRLLDLSQDRGFGSSLIQGNSSSLDTGTSGATVTCAGVGVAPTATNTPVLPTPMPRAPGPNEMALDADADLTGIQPERAITGTDPFSVAVAVTALGSDPYEGYQWEAQFASSELALAGAVVERIDESGFALCQSPNIYPGAVVTIMSSCAVAGSTHQTTYVGQLATFPLRCVSDGPHGVNLADIAQDPNFGSTLISPRAVNLTTTTRSITINCSGIGQTSPATSTAAPTGVASATDTPTPASTASLPVTTAWASSTAGASHSPTPSAADPKAHGCRGSKHNLHALIHAAASLLSQGHDGGSSANETSHDRNIRAALRKLKHLC